MDRIQLQASKLWDLLFSDETGETYQSALNLTGTILKELAQLIWLVICSVFVFGAWFSDASVKTGNGLRTWIDDQGNPAISASTDKPDLADKGKSLLDTGRVGIANLLSQAREQLGLEPLPPTALKKKIEPATPKSEPKPEPKVDPLPAATQAASTAPSSTDTASTTTAPATTTATASTPSPFSATATSAAEVAAEELEEDTEETEEVTRESVDDGWSASEED